MSRVDEQSGPGGHADLTSICPQDRAGTDVQTNRNATKAPLTGNRSTKPPPLHDWALRLHICHANLHRHLSRTTLSSTCRASSAPLRDLLDAPTALAACCGFDLCHKYIL
jgi:hypothetical protein